jgi:tetratricopeptide (TPR) repeat protein
LARSGSAQKKTVEACNKLLALRKDDWGAHLLRGLARANQGDYEEAVADHTRAVELNPSAWAGWVARGHAYKNLRRWDEALADYRAALRLRPRDADTHFYLAWVSHEKGDYRAAVSGYTRVLELRPDDHVAMNNRGLAWFALGETDKALAEYTAALKLKPRFALLYRNRGDLFAERGQRGDEARARDDFAVAAKLGDIDPCSRHALMLLRSGDLDAHRRACAEMLQRFSSLVYRPAEKHALAWACVRAPGAVTDLTGVIELARNAVMPPRASKQRTRTWEQLTTLGTALYRAERYKEAAEQLEQAVKAHGSGGAPESLLVLAMTRQRLGSAGAARQARDQAVRWIDDVFKDAEKRRKLGWARQAELELLRGEAERLLGVH